MRSRSRAWLVAKDWHELFASRAYWILLLATGLLVGHAFLAAVDAYAEMSGAGNGPAALAQGLSPLDGIVVPVADVLTLVAMLLLPFVVIRLVAHERINGGWKLLVQGPASIRELVSSKVGILLAAWLIASAPVFLALLLWSGSGNHLARGETLSVLLGELLFAWLAIGIAAAAAAIMEGEANAAIVTLSFTIGTWALDYVGAVQGGVAARIAAFTPGAVLRSFQQGLIRPDAAITILAAGCAGIAVAAIWLTAGRRRAVRWAATGAVVIVAAAISVLAARSHRSWDVSEDRRNSFSVADEATLRSITAPLEIEVHLAAEDPRLTDLRRNVLDKLERAVPRVEIRYVARTRTGLFEQSDSSYGEVWYQIGSRRMMSRSATEPIVLELLYQLAGKTPPSAMESAYPGYPLVRRPGRIAMIFFIGWPILLLAAFALRGVIRGKRYA